MNKPLFLFQFPLETRDVIINLLKSREFGTSGYNTGKQVGNRYYYSLLVLVLYREKKDDAAFI